MSELPDPGLPPGATDRSPVRPPVARRAVLGAGVAFALAGCSVDGRDPLGSAPTTIPDASDDAAPSSSSAEAPPSTSSTPPPAPTPTLDAAAQADADAGVLSRTVDQVAAGTTSVVPGSVAAVADGKPWRVRVEVEDGLPVDGAAFAQFVIATLQDPRGWVNEGWAFSRTDGDADVVVTLASPDTSQQMCAPLQTMGTLSCRNGDRAVLTYHRWVNGSEGYGADLTGYRQYVVSHEVGHSIGHGHVGCPGAGQLAPTMMQQTKGVGSCTAQPWPYP